MPAMLADIPIAIVIILAIALLLLGLVVRNKLKNGALGTQELTWLKVASIFVIVSAVVLVIP